MQDGIKYHFLSFCYDLTWDWTPISWTIGEHSTHLANSPVCTGGSIPGWVIPKTKKMVLDAALLNTQYYEVRTKGKVEQSKERSSDLSYTSVS